MVKENFERRLRAFARRAPFKPFVVELISGTTIQVDHPEALVSRGGVAVHSTCKGRSRCSLTKA
jgi:hypothetical protein